MALASRRSARRIFRPGIRSAGRPDRIFGGHDVEQETLVDQKTGRKCYLDFPSDLSDGEEVTFILNLHGGGSVGAWQREYFPAYDYADAYRLVIATPSAATKEPIRHWAAEADDEYLADLVEAVVERFGARNIRSFWLVGHSQGGMTSNRLLSTNRYFAERVDGWLSLSGGRLGLPAERAANAGPPRSEAERARMEEVFARRRIFEPPPPPTADFSFIYATGEHEIASLPETSPWAERYGAEARVRMADVVDTQPGKIHDGRFDAEPDQELGAQARPGHGPGVRVPQCQGRPSHRRRGQDRQGPHRGTGAPDHRGAHQADGLGPGRKAPDGREPGSAPIACPDDRCVFDYPYRLGRIRRRLRSRGGSLGACQRTPERDKRHVHERRGRVGRGDGSHPLLREAVSLRAGRVSIVIKIDHRPGVAEGALAAKVASVEGTWPRGEPLNPRRTAMAAGVGPAIPVPCHQTTSLARRRAEKRRDGTERASSVSARSRLAPRQRLNE